MTRELDLDYLTIARFSALLSERDLGHISFTSWATEKMTLEGLLDRALSTLRDSIAPAGAPHRSSSRRSPPRRPTRGSSGTVRRATERRAPSRRSSATARSSSGPRSACSASPSTDHRHASVVSTASTRPLYGRGAGSNPAGGSLAALAGCPPGRRGRPPGNLASPSAPGSPGLCSSTIPSGPALSDAPEPREDSQHWPAALPAGGPAFRQPRAAEAARGFAARPALLPAGVARTHARSSAEQSAVLRRRRSLVRFQPGVSSGHSRT